MFQSAKITDPYGFHKPVPFEFIFPQKDKIAGREVIHVGSGVYVFQENVLFRQKGAASGRIEIEAARKFMEPYSDLSFLTYSRSARSGCDVQGGEPKTEPLYGIAFVVSNTRGLYTADILRNMFYKGRLEEYFDIPEENRWFIRDFETYGKNEEYNIHLEGHHDYAIQPGIPGGKLQFAFTPETYEREEGKYCRYMLLQGKIGYHVGKGIYEFRGCRDVPYIEDHYDDVPFLREEEYLPFSENPIDSENYYMVGFPMWG